MMETPKLYIANGRGLLLVPILPGKAEAWQRLMQELAGSQRVLFCGWLEALCAAAPAPGPTAGDELVADFGYLTGKGC